MEMYDEHDFMEELLGLRRETWEYTMATSPSQLLENQFLFSNINTNFDCFDPNSSLSFLPNSSSRQQLLPDHQTCNTFNEIYSSLLDEFSASYPTTIDNTPPPNFLGQQDHTYPSLSSIIQDDDEGLFQSLDLKTTCKTERTIQLFNLATSSTDSERSKNRSKRVQGQPSKNLMAERRRRKRLNDRLSMLRSIVPKISKMDRTSILGDTIDYMKELLEKIKSLHQQIDVDSNMLTIFKDVKPNEIVVRNSPKFDVERRNVDTKVEIFCTGKPGLLLSTVNTLEALGLEIQQCVISCFNDFTLQASCSEELEQRTILSSEDIKQALFRNAGYGGRCL